MCFFCTVLPKVDIEPKFDYEEMAPDVKYETKISSSDDSCSALLSSNLYLLGEEYIPYDNIFPSEIRESK